MDDTLIKYPRTQHIEGSGLQGDDDPNVAEFRSLAGKYLVVEEKMDGANCGISFDAHGQLRLQSRGHFLSGGPRERQFTLFKSWASAYSADLWDILGDQYIMYGEWCYAKHTTFYTDLPHYFLEFDIYERKTQCFLSTKARRELLEWLPFVVSVKVLHEGPLPTLDELRRCIGPSHFIGNDLSARLSAAAREVGLDPEQAIRESDTSGLMEGLYIKVETEREVTERYKLVRRDFIQTLVDSGSHWHDRPILPNQLQAGVSLW